MKKDYYFTNKKYSRFINQGKYNDFSVLTKYVLGKLEPKDKYLDVGCGTGAIVEGLVKAGIDAYGVEVSRSSLAIASKKSGSYKLYDGKKIPYKSRTFDAVGSFNVLEHVQDVNNFLKESKRVLKKDGHLIICTPNFMSITNSFHYRTCGAAQKIKNIGLFCKKLFSRQAVFDNFDPVFRENFRPDDDATNLTNPLDIFRWGKENNMKLVNYVGSILPPRYPSHYLGKVPILNLFTGGVFAVFKK